MSKRREIVLPPSHTMKNLLAAAKRAARSKEERRVLPKVGCPLQSTWSTKICCLPIATQTAQRRYQRRREKQQRGGSSIWKWRTSVMLLESNYSHLLITSRSLFSKDSAPSLTPMTSPASLSSSKRRTREDEAATSPNKRGF